MPVVRDGIIDEARWTAHRERDIGDAVGADRLRDGPPEVPMLDAGKALTAVSTDNLTALLRAVHREPFEGGFATPVLAARDLLPLQDAVGFLHGLDDRAVKAVLVAVLAERRTPRLRG